MARIGACCCTHHPAVHPGFLDFYTDVCQKHRVDRHLHLGDNVDWHAVSYHPKHPDAPGPLDEWELSKRMLQPWKRRFPDLECFEGNHDERIIRLASSVNIPSRFLKSYNELFDTPTWKWRFDLIVDDVYYFHGTGHSGKYPAATVMEKMLMSVVMGHIHTAAGVWWKANPLKRIFGMNLGAGCDDKHLALRYAQHCKAKSILSCGVILDGIPQHVIMPCSPGEKYHASRFKKRRR